MTTETPTLIIGASASGLAVARCLEEAGAAAITIDAEPDVGRTWRNAYERLHLHTPRSKSGLPFLPMPRDYPLYASRQQVVDYLEYYAGRLKRPPLFGHRATSVRRDGTRWRTETAQQTFISDAVVIATGNTRVPSRATWSGMDRFLGPILHTADYRSGEGFRGQRVLVVGFGNSACEIAIDLHEHGAAPELSVRGAVNVIPRDIFGIPVLSLGILQKLLPARLADAINAPIINLIVGDITRLGLRKLAYGATTQIREHAQVPLLDVGTIDLIRGGAIGVRPGIEHFTERGVLFADRAAADYDAVILGTGYRAALAELLPDAAGSLDKNGTPVVSGDTTVVPGLYFCGFTVVPGGTLRQIGLEARRVARLIAAGHN